jgi:hypothetical protein
LPSVFCRILFLRRAGQWFVVLVPDLPLDRTQRRPRFAFIAARNSYGSVRLGAGLART